MLYFYSDLRLLTKDLRLIKPCRKKIKTSPGWFTLPIRAFNTRKSIMFIQMKHCPRSSKTLKYTSTAKAAGKLVTRVSADLSALLMSWNCLSSAKSSSQNAVSGGSVKGWRNTGTGGFQGQGFKPASVHMAIKQKRPADNAAAKYRNMVYSMV